MIVEELKKSILISAFKGNLSERLDSDSNVEELLKCIDQEKEYLIKQKQITKPKSLDIISDKEKPFIIPNEWKWVRWGELSNSIQYGLNAGAQTKGKAKLVRISDIQNNEIVWDLVPYCEINETEISQYILNENDILFARTGGTVGKSVIVKNIPTDVPYVFAGYLIRSNYSSKMNYKYLKYFMESPLYWEQLKNGTIGSAQPNCNGQTLSKMILPLPSIEEQQRIVDKIEELFAKLDELKPIEEELNKLKSMLSSEMRISIVDYAIHGKLTCQLHEDSDVEEVMPDKSLSKDNYKKFNLCIHENEYPFSIPQNWKWVKLGMLFNYQNGYSYKPSETLKNGKGFPVIKSQNIMKRVVEINNQTSFVENPTNQMLKSKINKGDFLMCLSSQSSNSEPLGKTAIYENDDIALLNQRVLKLTPLNKKISKYLYYVINSFYFHYTVSHKGGGSAQSNLKLEHVMEMYIPLPPIEEQQRIVDKLEHLLPLCDEIDNIINI